LRAFPDSDGVWRYPIQLENVSPLYIEALLTYEDRWSIATPASIHSRSRARSANGSCIGGSCPADRR